MELSFVIPCYNSQYTISNVVERILDMRIDCAYEIILVNDGSRDDTQEVLKALTKENDFVRMISLAKNAGQHAAVMAGLCHTAGEVVVCLDDDGQTPIENFPDLIQKLKEGYDVVSANYICRSQSSCFRRLGTFVNHKMAEWLIGKPKGVTVSAFFAAKRFVVDEITKYRQPYPYLAGLILRTTDRIGNVDMVQKARSSGQSGYTFRKLLNLWLNGFTAFSIKPLRAAVLCGGSIALAGLVLAVVTVVQKLSGAQIQAGWSSLITIVLMIGGLILIMLGIMGEYVGRIYMCINHTPQYVVRSKAGFDSGRDQAVHEKNKQNIGMFVLGSFLFGILSLLFYHQAVSETGNYASDLPAHIQIAVEHRGYSFLYWVLGVVYGLFGYLGVAFFESAIVLCTWMITVIFLKQLTGNKGTNREYYAAYFLLFLTSIYIPGIYEWFYLRTVITQPWHNITYFGMRFFAVWTMFCFGKIYESYLFGLRISEWLSVAGPLLFATAVKPNFLLSFSFALLLILIRDGYRQICQGVSFLVLRNIVLLGMTVLPSCLVLYIQSLILYPRGQNGGEHGIALIWGEKFVQFGLLPTVLKCMCGLSFPLLVWIYHKKTAPFGRFIYLMYAVTLLQTAMLSETGERENYGNFYWGLYNSAYILFAFCLSVFMKDGYEKQRKKGGIYFGIGILLLLGHVLSGFYYFSVLFMGEGYGI